MEQRKDNPCTVALLEAQKQIGKVAKNKVNPHFKSAYADYEAVLDAVKGPLNENGFVIVHRGVTHDGRDYLRTELKHISGLDVESELPLVLNGNPQHGGSLITYLKRYNLSALTGLSSGEDDDANAAVPSMTAEDIENARKARQTPASNPEAKTAHETKKPTAVRQPEAKEQAPSGDWKAVCIHFGKNRDKALGGLTKKTLYGWWANWKPEPWKGHINANDQRLRDALDAAGSHYGFGAPKAGGFMDESAPHPEEAVDQRNQQELEQTEEVPW